MDIRRIKDLREDHSLTQKQIAEYLHVAQRTYSGYKNGTTMIPVWVLIQLARYYNTSVDYLMGLTDQKEPQP